MADVEITYKLIPTAQSIETQASKVAEETDKQVGKAIKKSRGAFDKALDVFRTLNPRSYPTERFHAAGRLGKEGMEGGLGPILPVLTGILAATVIIAAFFEAVGPIIKMVMKLLTFFILLIMLPFIKLFLKAFVPLAKFLLVAAQVFSKLLDFLLTPVSAVTGVVSGAFNLGAWALQEASKWVQTAFDFGATMVSKAPELITGLFDFGGWLLQNIINFFNPIKFDFTDWISIFLLGPLGLIFKRGLETIFSFSFEDVLSYFMAKFVKMLIDGVNGIINLLKGIKLPVFQGIVWGKGFGGFPVPVGLSWGESSPFSGLSNIATPSSITSTINDFEKPKQQQSITINNTNYFESNLEKDYLTKLMEQRDRRLVQDLRGKTSYWAGSAGT